ncbi:MAG: tetratricopeptide repeat protein, partial [Burkholderiaceae bacterium]
MRNGVAAGAAYRPAKVVPKAEKKYQQGLALMQQGRWDEAARAFEAAIERSPKDALFWLNLARARHKQGDAAAAEQAARRALELDPRSGIAQRMLAEVLPMQGRAARIPSIAAGTADSAVSAFLEAGLALLQAEQFKEATEKFMEALRRKPDCVPAHMGLGNAFARLGAPLLAAECFRTAVTLAPGDAYAWSALVHQSMHACYWGRLDEDLRGLAAAQGAHPDRQPVAFTHLSIPGATAAEHLRSAAAFARAHIGTPPVLPRVAPSERRPGRIRVGYLSSDFCEHATSYLLAHVLELHDRDRFEIFLYSYGPDDRSPMRRRIEVAAEHFVELREAGAPAMAERIRADAIDILIDLKGYTYGSRPEVLGYRAAPIQVNFLGYPGTLGTPLADYIVTDPIVTPPEAAKDYVEKFAYLPDCYQPNDRKRPIGPPVARADCGLPERGFVFCCFNNTYKITPAMFDVWCRLLAQVEGSVLWLLDANLQAKDNLRAEARARGVAPERLVFAPKLPLAQHLARLANADLVLDTLPYNAHTTASDALWAGVPLVTCPGETFASRVAASLL